MREFKNSRLPTPWQNGTKMRDRIEGFVLSGDNSPRFCTPRTSNESSAKYFEHGNELCVDLTETRLVRLGTSARPRARHVWSFVREKYFNIFLDFRRYVSPFWIFTTVNGFTFEKTKRTSSSRVKNYNLVMSVFFSIRMLRVFGTMIKSKSITPSASDLGPYFKKLNP